jgi:hypothetical protein
MFHVPSTSHLIQFLIMVLIFLQPNKLQSPQILLDLTFLSHMMGHSPQMLSLLWKHLLHPRISLTLPLPPTLGEADSSQTSGTALSPFLPLACW